jgi:ribosomal protein S9
MIKLGIAKIIYKLVDEKNKQKIKESGMLTRNSLCKERRSLNCYL